MLRNNNIREYLSRFTFETVGNLWFLLLLIYSVVFFMERSLTFDSAHYLVHMVEHRWFHIEHFRYGAFVMQILPVLCLKLGVVEAGHALPLQIVALAWSVNYILVYWLLWRFIVYTCKNKTAGIAFFLFSGLAVRHLFYWPISELQQFMFWSLALWGWLGAEREFTPWIKYSVTFLLSLQCAVTYPLFPFFAAFIAFERFMALEKWSMKSLLNYSIPIGVIVLAFLIQYFFIPQYIHPNRFENYAQLKGVFPRFWELEGANYFSFFTRSWYSETLWILGGGLLMALIRKKWLLSAGTLLFAFGYFMLVLAGYPTGDSALISENLLQPFSFLACVIFSTQVLSFNYFPSLSLPVSIRMGPVLAGICVIYYSSKILEVSDYYTRRFLFYESIEKSQAHTTERKFLMDIRNLTPDIFLGTGTIAAETMLWSTMRNRENPFVVYVHEKEMLERLKNDPNSKDNVPFAGWDSYMSKRQWPEFDAAFPIRHTEMKMLNMSDSVSPAAIHAALYSFKFGFEILNLPVLVHKHYNPVILVKIYNGSGIILPSTLESEYPVYLTYRFYLAADKVAWDGPNIPLIYDMDSVYYMPFVLNHPNWRGGFDLRISVFCPALDSMSVQSQIFKLNITD